MHAWETIELSLDFIEEHLEEEIKIETLADVAALSPFYFQTAGTQAGSGVYQAPPTGQGGESIARYQTENFGCGYGLRVFQPCQLHADVQRNIWDHPRGISDKSAYAQLI